MEVRERLGFKNRELFAVAYGISKKTYEKYEQGSSELPTKLLLWLQNERDVNLNWLITGEGEMFEASSAALDANAAQMLNGFQKLPPDLQRDLLEIMRMDLRRAGLL